jgi:aspartate aminotransferase-like enzyme
MEKRFTEIAGLSAALRERLVEMGFDLVGNGAQTSPAVITVALPAKMTSQKIGEAMQEAGYLLSYNSEYLRRKNWIQICLMGECPREKVIPAANALNRVCFSRAASPAVTA